MACKDATTKINGRAYYVIQMAPRKSYPLQLKIARLLAAVTPKLALLKTGNLSALPDILDTAFGIIPEETLLDIMYQVVETAKVDGERINIDDHFQGEYMGDLYAVFFWVLEVNYGDFIDAANLKGFKQVVAQRLAAMASESKSDSPQTSSGTSGDQ